MLISISGEDLVNKAAAAGKCFTDYAGAQAVAQALIDEINESVGKKVEFLAECISDTRAEQKVSEVRKQFKEGFMAELDRI